MPDGVDLAHHGGVVDGGAVLVEGKRTGFKSGSQVREWVRKGQG